MPVSALSTCRLRTLGARPSQRNRGTSPRLMLAGCWCTDPLSAVSAVHPPPLFSCTAAARSPVAVRKLSRTLGLHSCSRLQRRLQKLGAYPMDASSSSDAVDGLLVQEEGNAEAGGSGGGNDESKGKIDWGITSLIFVFPALAGALFGYDIGATSGALVSLSSATTSGTDWYALTSFQSGLVVSSSLGGALVGSMGAFLFGDKLGRRKELLLASALYATAAAIMYTAPSLGILLVGRTTYGLGIGFGMHAAPAYIAEVCPPQVRGLLISLKEGFVVGGILIGYLIGNLSIGAVGGWRTMYGASFIPAIVLGLGMAWLMESPRWLFLSGAPREQAVAALERARGKYSADSAAVEKEATAITRSLQSAEAQAAGASGIQQLFAKNNVRPLLIGMSLMLFQQITGQPSVLYYAARVFKDAGFASDEEATRVSVYLGLFKLVCTGVAVLTVDKAGRRPLLLGGVAGIIVALLLLSGAQTLPEAGPTALLSVGALLLYVGAYQVSFGPISWLLVGEIFPLSVRSQASALATITNFGSNFGVSLVLPSIQEKFGLGNTYLAFAGIGAIALVSIYLTVPETKGKTLEEIEALFSSDDKA